ncbi:hypothetical protein BA768_18765 [Chryseobacterium sp. CBo1]|uniref:hypothetical protein n=1 Tax=Chryseobacterium sp. CBo1 TaxID=1869230 RepID=UPI0008104978|nr:hypothetical protein [Chryseobacterium sp. CBo1]OCK50825.1 hypothetical protein BA768_18765 [Chryseobacterium sp. CBo1]
MKVTLFYFLFISALLSCQEKIKLNMPEYDDVMMTSNSYNLPYNVNFTQETLPKKLKRFEQKSNDKYLNILEYDRNSNLIFKYYRQFVSENWNGKYLTIIERNFYNNKNQIIKTIVLNSNTGSSENEYNYDSEGNLILVKTKGIPAEGNNNNPWRYIENLVTSNDFDNDKNVIKVDKNNDYNYFVYQYDFDKKQVSAFFKNQESEQKFHVVYKFNSLNQLVSKTAFDENSINYSNSYFIEYKGNYKITKEYDDEKNLTQTTVEFKENSFTNIETVNMEFHFKQERKYFGKTLVFDNSFSESENEKISEKYELDNYYIPVKMTRTINGKIDSEISFVNKYEFFKD